MLAPVFGLNFLFSLVQACPCLWTCGRAQPVRQQLHLVLYHLHIICCSRKIKDQRKLVSSVSLKLVSRYGIKKLSGVHRRTKALKKLDMSRCQLSQNGFYELIPIILKSEHVILQVSISSLLLLWIILNSKWIAGQPDHPVGAEDIFRPAEVNIILGIQFCSISNLIFNYA